MNEKQIRTELLYCDDDPVKKQILKKYLNLITAKKKKSKINLPKVETNNNDNNDDHEDNDDQLLDEIFNDNSDNDETSIGSSLDEFIMQEEEDENKEPVKPKDHILNRDHLNNNLMERMNSDILIRGKGIKNRQIQFESPFGEGGTDIYPSFYNQETIPPNDFSNK